jgi:CRP/FNR family transcriptional regulator
MARLENRMVNLLQRDVKERLLYFFFNLTRQFPQYLHGNSFDMTNILTHEDVARLIASSRQTVTTFINQLEQEGMILFSRQLLQIPDVKKLQNRLSVG